MRHMKKTLSLILTFCLLLATLPAAASADNEHQIGTVYNENGGAVGLASAVGWTAGATITVGCEPKSGYILQSVSYVRTQGTTFNRTNAQTVQMADTPVTMTVASGDVTYSQSGTFVMPDYDILIFIDFVTDPPQAHTVTVNNPSTGHGTVALVGGSGSFHRGETVTLSNSPDGGYRRYCYLLTHNLASMPIEFLFTDSFEMPDHDVTVTGFFVESICTLSAVISPDGGGTVEGTGTYPVGETAYLTAVPNAGYAFDHWVWYGSNVGNAQNVEIKINSPGTATITAVFRVLEQFTIAASAAPATGGTVSGAGTYYEGKTVTLTATPNDGYAFAYWTENDTTVSTDATYSFTASADRALQANFRALEQFTIAASAAPAAGGTVSGAGTYREGSAVTLTATAKPGFTFVNWTANGAVVSANAAYTFTADTDLSLTANFVPAYTVTVFADPSEGGAVSGGGQYALNSTVTLTATPGTGYDFVYWTENDTVASSDAAYSFTASADRTLTAHFIRCYTVSAAAAPAAGGTVSGSCRARSGSQVTLTATPADRYVFRCWTENGQVVSRDAAYSFTASADRTLTAKFLSESSIAEVSFLYYTADSTGQRTQHTDTQSVVLLGADDTVWGESGMTTWYAATGTVEIRQRVTALGDVRLILCDGAAVDAGQGVRVETGNSLTVYAQSEGGGMGVLTANGSLGGDQGADDTRFSGFGPGGTGGDAGAVTVHGGTVTVNSSLGGGNGGYSTWDHGGNGGNAGPVTVYGGTVTVGNLGAGAGGGSQYMSGGSSGSGDLVSIYGGAVTVNGSLGGDLTLVDGVVTVNGGVSGDLTLVDGMLKINAGLSGNATVNGGSVEVRGMNKEHGGAAVNGNVTLNNGSIIAVGGLGMDLTAGGPGISGNVTLNGGSARFEGGKSTAAGGESGYMKGVGISGSVTLADGKAALVIDTGEKITDSAAAKERFNAGKTLRVGTLFSGTWSELQAALNLGGTLLLDADIKAASGDKALVVPYGTAVTLDLNGHVIDRGMTSRANYGNALTVLGDLTLADSRPAATHDPAITYTDPLDSAKTFAVNGGVITGGNLQGTGGGVAVGVNYGAQKASFTMDGGTICGNGANAGGGVGINPTGTFTMTGGTICGNSAQTAGGGVDCDSLKRLDCNFLMTGGTICGNRAQTVGGGVYIGTDVVFTTDGGEIKGNKADTMGGGVYVGRNAVFTADGGVISGNEADAMGGGVYIGINAVLSVSGSPQITGNHKGSEAAAADYGNDLYLPGNSVVTVGGVLTAAARIGVRMETPGVFISAPVIDPAALQGALTSFFSNDPAYCLAGSGSGTAGLTPRAAISALPAANNRIGDGTAQPLLTGGAADNGTLCYAIGTDAVHAPAAGQWESSVPRRAETGTYYVWIKAVGEGVNSESAAQCVTARVYFPVTFEVVGGEWDAGGSGPIVCDDVSRYANEDLALVLKSSDFPAVGAKPGEGFKAGSWNPIPLEEKNVSSAETYTYAYQALTVYTITLDANGGAFAGGAMTLGKTANEGTYVYTVAADAEQPGRSGHSFRSWALDKAGKTPLEEARQLRGDVTLFAQWTENAKPAPAPVYYAPTPAAPKETRFEEVDVSRGGSLANFKAVSVYTPGMFADAGEDDWYSENLKAAVELGILEGMGDGTFGVGQPLKLSETLAIACRLHNLFYGGSGKFDQSKDENWYQVYEDYAVKYGFLRADELDLTKPATRAQFAAILAAALPDEALAPINAVTALPDMATDDPRLPVVLKLYNAGILTGVDGAGSFAPDAPIPREQVAAMATRVADPALRKAFALE